MSKKHIRQGQSWWKCSTWPSVDSDGNLYRGYKIDHIFITAIKNKWIRYHAYHGRGIRMDINIGYINMSSLGEELFRTKSEAIRATRRNVPGTIESNQVYS